MLKLSILVPTVYGREKSLDKLTNILYGGFFISEQLNKGIAIADFGESELIILKDNKEISIGEKRNKLLGMANGEYVCFTDDDDEVSNNYIKELMEGINKGVDCCSLKGIITTDGADARVFEHSLKYNDWKTNGDNADVKYERPPNHLNCIRASIAKQFKFREIKHGEDHIWSMDIQRSGLLQTEHYINDIIYYYNYKTVK